MAKNINELIKEQHQEAKDTYKKFQNASSKEERERLAKQLLTDLTVHADLEEELYYPEYQKHDETALADEYKAEHQQMKILVSKLAAMNISDEAYDPNMKALMESVEQHIAEEESKGLPRMEKLVSEDRLEELGKQFEDRNKELHESTLKRLWATIT